MAFSDQNSFSGAVFSSSSPAEQPPPMPFAPFGSSMSFESRTDAQPNNVSMFGQLGGFDFMSTTSANLTAVKSSGSTFGATATSSTHGFFGAFGAPAAINSHSGFFGAPTAGTSSNIFGAPVASKNSDILGAPAGSTDVGFGARAVTSKASVVFGATTSTTGSGMFGAAPAKGTGANPGFSNVFGATTGSSSVSADAVKSSGGLFGVSFTDGCSQKTFEAPSRSTQGGFHGGFRAESVRFSGASGSSQIPGSGIPSSGGQFASHTFSQFSSIPFSSGLPSASSSGVGFFGKQAKPDEHEASKHVSFRKVSEEDQSMEKFGAGGNRNTSGKSRIPDLMSLSPGRFNEKDARSGVVKLFGKAMTDAALSSDQNLDRRVELTSDGLPVKGRSPLPSSSRHVVAFNNEDMCEDQSRSIGHRVSEKSG